jgi:hypothetical protein
MSSSTAGIEEAQKRSPWTGASALQLHIWREKRGCPVYQVAGCKDKGFQKNSSKRLQRREGNVDGVQYHANYISRMGLFSYGTV